ncbi:MAG: AmmeMemoRadiSam system radical SAM enzyme [bacterium]|nr:AmmeMemoRadiSam system radical SAM enzyme [bacterium]
MTKKNKINYPSMAKNRKIFFFLFLFSSVLSVIIYGLGSRFAESGPSLFGAVRKITVFQKSDALKADLSLREALFYFPLENGDVQCGLCPRRCVLRDGQRGLCRVRVNYGGKLYSLVYGKPVAVHIDPIEKKPLYHFLPGSTTFSFATAGCNLSCVFCQNWEISQAYPENTRHFNITPEEIISNSLKEGCDSIAFTYTEPTVFYEYMLDTAKLAKQNGLKTVCITCGFVEEEPLRELCKYIDAANVDLKGFSENFYAEYTKSSLRPVLETLRILKEENIHTELTNLIIPGVNDSETLISDMCSWIAENIGTDIPVHFSRFYPHYQLRNKPPTSVKTLLSAKKIARSKGLKYVYIGNVAGEELSDTHCPSCGRALIKRKGYYIESNNIKDGRCEHCGTVIPGVW